MAALAVAADAAGTARRTNHHLEVAPKLLANRECGADTERLVGAESAIAMNLASLWRRAFRHRAEREATMNALRVAAGQPIVAQSECSDGTWQVDGNTLAFSRALEARESDMPVTLRVR